MPPYFWKISYKTISMKEKQFYSDFFSQIKQDAEKITIGPQNLESWLTKKSDESREQLFLHDHEPS